MKIDRVDYFVPAVASINATCEFNPKVLCMDVTEIAGGRKALTFGAWKINLHQMGKKFEPKTRTPMPGSGDSCLIAAILIENVVAHLDAHGIEIEEGIDRRTGATCPIQSVYLRDPDGNLIEISEYV